MISKIIKHVIIIILVYMYIYSPPLTLLPFGLIKLILPLVYFVLFFSRKHRKALLLFKNELLILIVILFYSFFTAGFNFNFEFPFVYQNFGLLFEAFPIAVFLAAYIIDVDKKNINTLLNTVFYVGLIASVISCYLIVNPEANYQMNNEILRTSSWLQEVKFRGFGFASMLSFAYGITQGIICAIAIYFLSQEKKVFKRLFLVLAIIIFLISIFVNARIGIFPVFIILFYFIIIKRKVKLSLFIAIFVFALTQINYESDYVDVKTIKYALDFFSETDKLISGSNEKTTFDILLEMIIFPSNIKDLIFGSGYSLFGKLNKSSDIGYILQIWFGGIIYLSLLLSLVVLMAKKIVKIKNYNWFLYLFLGTILVCNIKGYFISNNSAFRLLILIYVGLIYINKSNFIAIKSN